LPQTLTPATTAAAPHVATVKTSFSTAGVYQINVKVVVRHFPGTGPDFVAEAAWTLTQTVKADTMTFTGLARACAGGVAVDSVHDFTIVGTAKNGLGAVLANQDLMFTFVNNKGHDYTNDAWKPANWTDADTKKAKFATQAGNAQWIYTEELAARTDAQGNISLHVLSSDIVSTDITIQVIRTLGGSDYVIGNQACDFGQALGYRRFMNPYYTDEEVDEGWLFNREWLGQPGTQTTVKIYMKFMINPQMGDTEGNWNYVNGHRMLVEVDQVDLTVDAEAPLSANEDYITWTPVQADGTSVTANDGAATVAVTAGSKIVDADTLWFAAYDQSQWAN